MKLLIALIVSCIQLNAGILIKFDVAGTTISQKNAEKSDENIPLKKTQNHKLELFLDAKQIVYKEADSLLVLDFDSAANDTYYSSNSGETYKRSSMYSTIAFREKERLNRQQMGNILAAAGAEMKKDLMDPVQMDHLFSTKLEKEAKLERKEKEGVVSFLHKGKIMLRYSSNGSALDKNQQKQLIVALKFKYGIHPDILTELAGLGKCPDWIEITIHDMAVKSYRLSKTKVLLDQNSPVATALDKLKLEEKIDDKLAEPALKKLREQRKLGFEKITAGYLATATKLMEAKKPFEAFLYVMAHSLATSENLSKETIALVKEAQADARVLQLIGALTPRDEKGIKNSLKIFTDLLNEVDDGKAILHIFRANMYEGLKQKQPALDEFWAALSMEPMIVGAWKNVGDIYLDNYEADKAWQCWQIAEGIFPEHKFLQDVTQKESRLRMSYPEYFLTEK